MHESEKVCSPARQLCQPPCFFAHLCYDEVVRGKHPWAGGELGLLMFESNNFKCVFT